MLPVKVHVEKSRSRERGRDRERDRRDREVVHGRRGAGRAGPGARSHSQRDPAQFHRRGAERRDPRRTASGRRPGGCAAPRFRHGSTGGVSRTFKAVLDGVHRNELRVLVPGRRVAEDLDAGAHGRRPGSRAAHAERRRTAREHDRPRARPTRESASTTSSSPPPTRPATARRLRLPHGAAARRLRLRSKPAARARQDTMGWIALAVLLAAALPVAAVVWARS